MASELDATKLTAYALGELDDAERAVFEAQVAASESARREVDEIKAAAALLKQAFGSAPRHELTLEQRQTIEAAAGKPPRRRWIRYTTLAAGTAAAATLVFAVAMPSLMRARMARVPDGMA